MILYRIYYSALCFSPIYAVPHPESSLTVKNHVLFNLCISGGLVWSECSINQEGGKEGQ